MTQTNTNTDTMGSVKMGPTTGTASPVTRTRFLSAMRIDHGPPDVLGRFFIAADRVFAEVGIDLVFAGFDDLERTNAINRDSWKPLNPTFVPTNGLVGDADSFAILGLVRGGGVVSAAAAKLFRWHNTDLIAEAASLRFLYADPVTMSPPGAHCDVTAPSAGTIRETVAYAGAAWLHPSMRKRGLASVQARLIRAVCYSRWGMDVVFGISSVGLISRGYSDRNGWQHVEPGVSFSGLESCPPEAGLVWMTSGEIIADLRLFLGEAAAGRHDAVELGSAQNAPPSADLERQYQARIARYHTAS